MDLRKDIYFYADLASFPASGAANLLYVDSATSLIYIWNGASYVASGAGGLKYAGLWDANANSPVITSGVGDTGEYYIVGTAGTTNIDGISDWGVGDWIIFGGSAWQKIDNSDREGYTTVEDEGTPLTQRSTINFVGSGVTAADSGGKTVVTIASGGLTEFTELETTAAPNATVPVNSLTPVTATTNADFAIVPKGNGAILADIPDNTTAGGNKRGQFSTDLQGGTRLIADQVSSGNYSTIAGGRSNKSSGTESICAGGYFNVASGDQSSVLGGQQNGATSTGAAVLGGASNTASASNTSIGGGTLNSASAFAAFVPGGYQNVASNNYTMAVGHFNTSSGSNSGTFGQNNISSGPSSYAIGQYASTNSINNRISIAAGAFATAGDCQTSKFILKVLTSGNTATDITSNGTAYANGTNNYILLSNQSAFRFKGTIVGKQSGSVNAAVWEVDGFIVRGANAAATTLNISNVNLVQNTPAWGTPTLAADTTIGCLRVQVTGAAATNIRWIANIETTEVIYA